MTGDYTSAEDAVSRTRPDICPQTSAPAGDQGLELQSLGLGLWSGLLCPYPMVGSNKRRFDPSVCPRIRLYVCTMTIAY